MKLWIYILLPTTALLFLETFPEQFETPKSFALVAFASFAFWFVNWAQLKTDRVAQAIALFTFSAAVSTVFSINPHMSFWGNYKAPMGLIQIASYLVLYLAMGQNIGRYFEQKTAVHIVMVCSAIVSIYALLQVCGIDWKVWTGTLTSSAGYTRPISTLGHSNFLAAYLAMSIPFALFLSDRAPARFDRYLFRGVALISAVVVFLSQSRGQWFAASAGMSAYLILSGATRRKMLRYLAVVGIISIVAAGIVPGLRQTAGDRLENVISMGPARLEYWKAAGRIWLKYPILGIGTDAYETGFQHQRTPYYWQIEKYGTPHKSHNEFLHVLSTQGIVGALACLILSWEVLVLAYRSRAPFAIPSIAAMVAFYVSGLSSFSVIAIGVMFVLCTALLKTPYQSNSTGDLGPNGEIPGLDR